MVKWHNFWQVKFKGDLPERAYDQKPDLDYPLQEALSGFYFMSGRRKISIGMTKVVAEPLSLEDIACYHQIFKPYLDLPHFARVVAAADRAYLDLVNSTGQSTK